MRDKIFISYSHEDESYLNALKIHLHPLELTDKLEEWDDQKILVGGDWEKEIMTAINETAVAILLISKDFLASDYILKKELPLLLEAYENEKIRIIPVILTTCIFSQLKTLSKLQAVNSPDKPLCGMKEDEQDKVWINVVALTAQAYETYKNTSRIDFFSPVEIVSHLSSLADPSTGSGSFLASAYERIESMSDFLMPDEAGWYHGRIVKARDHLRDDFRCYLLNKLVYNHEEDPVPNETHWLFYRAAQFADLYAGDKVMFRINKIDILKNWHDISNTRNIYITELYVDKKR